MENLEWLTRLTEQQFVAWVTPSPLKTLHVPLQANTEPIEVRKINVELLMVHLKHRTDHVKGSEQQI